MSFRDKPAADTWCDNSIHLHTRLDSAPDFVSRRFSCEESLWHQDSPGWAGPSADRYLYHGDLGSMGIEITLITDLPSIKTK